MFFILPSTVFSQIELKGVVKDNKTAIQFANVILLDSTKAVKKGGLSDQSGAFIINTPPGKYILTVGFVGYEKWVKEINVKSDTTFGDIILQPVTSGLNEVVVRARKKLITYKPDRLIFDVENSISASGGDAISAIKAAPGVIVQNNSINILGKGSSRVMVNGRMVELSGEDLMSFLKSISASDIQSVEVITNPPAKYEAGGDGGLINIVLKKGAGDAWKNSTNLSYERNTYNTLALRDNFFYNKNKVKFSFNASGKSGDTKIRQDLDTYYPAGPWELRYEGKQKQNNLAGGFTFDYDISDRTSIGVQYSGSYNNPDSRDHTNINILNASKRLDSLLVNTGFRGLSSRSHTYNTHLISKLDTFNRKFSVDLDYFTYNSKTDNSFVANTFSPEMEFLNTDQSARNVSNRNINNFSAKIDMEHPLKFFNLSYGGKFSFIDSKGGIQYFNTISAAPVLDPSRSDDFSYKENNQAIYVNGVKDINSKLSLQLGLRLENTQTEGYSATLNQINRNNYLKLFPTFYLSYKGNENNNFLFNYGRRINRPDFGILNPFRSYINSNSYSEGNPFLQPSFTDKFDFTYVYKGKLRTNLFLNITTNGFGPVFTSNPETNTLIITRQNYYKENYYGVGESYTADIAAWWQSEVSLYVLGSKSEFINHISSTPRNGLRLYTSVDNTFSLSKSTKLQADYFYSSPYQKGLYEYGYMSGLNIGIKQSLLRNNFQLSLLANDLFNTAYLRNYTSVVNGIKQVYSENNSSRFFRLSLTYDFGNDKVSVKQRKSGNEDEKRRSEN